MRRFLPLLAVLALLPVVGCGGGDDSTTPAGEGPGLAVESTAGGEAAQRNQAGKGQSDGGNAGAETEAGQPSGLPPSDSSSLPNQGSEDVAPGVPTTQGGDNSIQSYGVESSGDERAEAATAVKAYLDAQADGRWQEACTLLAAPIRRDLLKLWEQAKGPDVGGCPQAMAAAVSRIPKDLQRVVSDLHVLSMRVQGNRGFLIYEDATARASETPMQHEEDGWRIRALLPKELIIPRR